MALIIMLRNLSNLAPVSDYEYIVSLNGRHEIERGIVRGHVRADGWPALVRQLILQRKKDEKASDT